MPKHRGITYAVVRQQDTSSASEFDSRYKPVIIGTYATIMRAEEIAGRSAQTLRDLGVTGFTFEVQPTTWYDE